MPTLSPHFSALLSPKAHRHPTQMKSSRGGALFLSLRRQMDFTHFIANQDQIEPALKSGLYIVQQSHLPRDYQAFRCGLAGKPSDAAQQAFQGKQSSFATRFASYLNYWLPTNAKVFACLTVDVAFVQDSPIGSFLNVKRVIIEKTLPESFKPSYRFAKSNSITC